MHAKVNQLRGSQGSRQQQATFRLTDARLKYSLATQDDRQPMLVRRNHHLHHCKAFVQLHRVEQPVARKRIERNLRSYLRSERPMRQSNAFSALPICTMSVHLRHLNRRLQADPYDAINTTTPFSCLSSNKWRRKRVVLVSSRSRESLASNGSGNVRSCDSRHEWRSELFAMQIVIHVGSFGDFGSPEYYRVPGVRMFHGIG